MADKIVFNVKNWTLEQLLNLDPVVFNALNRSELVDVVSRLGSVGNKRITRIKEAGIKTPATWNAETGTYRIDITGSKRALNTLDLNDLRAQYVRTKNFLQAPTSTVTGGRKWIKESIKGLKEKGIELAPNEFDLFWQSYEAVKDFVPGLGDTGFKYAVLDAIKSRIERKRNVEVSESNIEDISRYIMKHKDDIYKNYARRQREEENRRIAEIVAQLSKRND